MLLLLHYLSGSIVGLWEYEYNTYSVIATIIRLFGSPGGSDSKESSCKAGDLGSIPVWVHGKTPGICELFEI